VRVAIDYTAAINQSAGIGRFVRSLVHALAEIDEVNHYLLIYAAPDGSCDLGSDLESRFPSARNFSRRQLRLSQRYLDILWHRLQLPVPVSLVTGPVDIYHSPDFVLPPTGGARSLLTVHDLAFLLQPECAEASLREYLERTVPRSVRRADFVVADSENTRNDVICLLGVPAERVAVVPGGVDPSFAPVEDACRLRALREQLGVGEAPFILALGVIEPRKNLGLLFDAYRILRDRHDLPHLLVVVGRRGWLWEDTIEHAERSPYAADIRFVGFVPDGDLPALYSAASVFAFPSLYEGFGLPPLEAMACGTPVVSSSSSSLPEVVGEAGLLIDPRDPESLASALERLLLDERLRAEYRRRGLAQAAMFTWQAAARTLLGVYERLASA
jgi:glycosyltransferase involved in cell wall biosynthesis